MQLMIDRLADGSPSGIMHISCVWFPGKADKLVGVPWGIRDRGNTLGDFQGLVLFTSLININCSDSSASEREHSHQRPPQALGVTVHSQSLTISHYPSQVIVSLTLFITHFLSTIKKEKGILFLGIHPCHANQLVPFYSPAPMISLSPSLSLSFSLNQPSPDRVTRK